MIKIKPILQSSLMYFLLLNFLMVSCTSSNNQQEAQDVELDEQVVMIEDESATDIVFPSLLQIASIFKRSGLDYVDGITNDADKLENYESQMSQSLNFGVYVADLSYCIKNGQTQNAMNYLANVKVLSDKLGISSVFDSKDLYTTFEENIDNQDSLIYVIANLQERLDDYLQNNEMDYLSAIYFTGGWVEAMHLATSAMNLSQNEAISSGLVEQTLILDVIVKGLSSGPHKDNPLIASIKEDLVKLKEMSDNFDFIKGREIEDIPFEEIQINAQEVSNLSKVIAQVRAKIVNG